MGNCMAQEHDNKTKQINRLLKVQEREEQNKIRILLLGAGDSGKSTFARQMKIVHLGGFTAKEKERFTSILRDNVMESFRMIYMFAKETLMDDKFLIDDCEKVIEEGILTEAAADIITRVWETKSFKSFVENSIYNQPNQTSLFLFEHVQEISSETFQPTDDYILHARMKSTGIQEVEFHLGPRSVILLDAGGQRSERRKWLGYFETVSIVIFIVALDEYNLTLSEDGTTNRLQESLQLFKDISGNQYLQGKRFVLFLNKFDIFKEKLSKVPLSDFVDIPKEHANNTKMAKKFMMELYKKEFQQDKEMLKVYTTCVLDTSNCKKVFDCIREQLTEELLMESGLLVS